MFDNEIIQSFNDESYADKDFIIARKEALDKCMKHLSDESRLIINVRYSKTKSVNEIAAEQNKSPNAISKVLHRSRLFLLKCISQNIAEGKSI